MFVRKGITTCEKCGESYEWYFRMIQSGEYVSGTLDDLRNRKNIGGYSIHNGYIIVSSKCPHCNIIQSKAAISEEYK